MPDPVRTVDRQVWRDGRLSEGAQAIPEETALALTYNGGTYAVMMGTPQDLEDFAVGFSLTEGIVARLPNRDRSLEVLEHDDGIELRMWLAQSRADRLQRAAAAYRRPTGCGLCGIDSLAEAVRPAAHRGAGRVVLAAAIMPAMQAMQPLQTINTQPAPSMPPPSGRRRAASSRCARMSAATTRSTSWPARWRGQHRRRRGHGAADQPRLGRDGAEGRGHRRAAAGRGLRADRAGGAAWRRPPASRWSPSRAPTGSRSSPIPID